MAGVSTSRVSEDMQRDWFPCAVAAAAAIVIAVGPWLFGLADERGAPATRDLIQILIRLDTRACPPGYPGLTYLV
jgi:hypothetical protein